MQRLLALILAGAATCAGATEWVRGRIVEAPLQDQITLQHAAIKRLGMGPMTMVFQVDAGVSLKGFKAGDTVRFSAHASGNSLQIDALQHAR